jgi:hypothetical protein
MNNLKIVKKTHRILIIAVLSYVVVLIGSLNIVLRIVPENYGGISAILTFAGTIILQICLYRFFLNSWLKKGFTLTSEPDELLGLLQNSNLINSKHTLSTIKDKYNIRFKKLDEIDHSDILPNEVSVFPNKIFNLFFFVFMALVAIGTLYMFIVENNPLWIIISIATILASIKFGRSLYTKTPILRMNNKFIEINNSTYNWNMISKWDIKQVNKEEFKLTIYEANREISVKIPFANYEPFEIDYYLKKYKEKNTIANRVDGSASS